MQNPLAPANAAALFSVAGHGRRHRRRERLNILLALRAFDWTLANQDRHSINYIRGCSNSVYEPNNPINQTRFETCRRDMVATFAAGKVGTAWNTQNRLAVFKFKVTEPGTSTWRVTDYSSARANYTPNGSHLKRVPAN